MKFQNPIGAHKNASIPVTGMTWSDETMQAVDLAGVIFTKCTFENIRMNEMDFTQTFFSECQFDDCIFEDCTIYRTNMIRCKGHGLRISGGVLAEIVFSECDFRQLILEQIGNTVTLAGSKVNNLVFNRNGCQQEKLTISDCQFDQVMAENIAVKYGSLVQVDFSCWMLKNAHMEFSNIIRTNGEDLDLSTIHLKQCNLYQSNLQRARIRSAESCIFADCELEEADFVEAELKGALFAKVKAVRAKFDRANLEGALFPKAILTNASFVGAAGKVSVWADADLTDANLQDINAFRGSFRNTILKGANMVGARLVEADLHGVQGDLDGADIRDARGTVEWREEMEAEARKPALQG